MLTEEQICHIFVEVADGRGHHGDFLKSFGAAIARADPGNLSLLAPAALLLITKYGLEKYLDTFEEER